MKPFKPNKQQLENMNEQTVQDECGKNYTFIIDEELKDCQLIKIDSKEVHGLARNTFRHPMGGLMHFSWDLQGRVQFGMLGYNLTPVV